ncbi:MAG: 3-hydroxyacyl-CoA dehydrogenase, partial [Betaproteobacteria bacterium]|nr:3-hydroxyacyl-CoA dehydrogenase [Betaproteobacteria bacterium]
MNTHFQQVAVVGAGAMGQGIAQMCAQAGAQVLVHDVAPGAAAKACQAIGAQWLKLQDKGRLTSQDV